MRDTDDASDVYALLSDKPVAWSRLIAARAALRVLPALLRPFHARAPQLWMLGFRACFIPWAGGKFPAHDLDQALYWASRSAYTGTRSLYHWEDVVDLNASAASCALASAEFAAGPSTGPIDQSEPRWDSQYSSYIKGAIARIAADSVARAAKAIVDPSHREEYWLAVEMDLNWLIDRGNAVLTTSFSAQPLWNYRSEPRWVLDRWQEFIRNKVAIDDGYGPWIDWYNGVQTGADPFGPDLTLRIAQQPDGWWNRPAAEVNADIAAWLKQRYQAATDAAADKSDILEKLFDKIPSQGPGPYRYATRNDRIYVLPPMNVDDPQGFAEDYRAEAREKAEELLERLNRSNADPQAARAVSRLLETLRPTLSGIRPALLDSRTLSVTAIADAFDNPRDEPELFAGAIAQLRDLGLTARRLCLCFPELRDIEADAMAFGLQPENVPTVLAATAHIAQAAKQSPLLEAETVVALDTVQEEAAQPAPEPVQRKRAAMAAQNVRNLLIEVISAVRRTGVATGGATWRVAKDTVETARPLLVQGSAYALVVAAADLAGEVLGPMYQLAMLAGGFKEIKDVLAAIKDLIKPNDPT